jgi:hypothetical protein
MRIPCFPYNCEHCEGGWAEPIDLPNDPLLAQLGAEPCPYCPAGADAEKWFQRNRRIVAQEVFS